MASVDALRTVTDQLLAASLTLIVAADTVAQENTSLVAEVARLKKLELDLRSQLGNVDKGRLTWKSRAERYQLERDQAQAEAAQLRRYVTEAGGCPS